MKTNIFILFFIFLNIFYSQNLKNEINKEAKRFFISAKDFEYFKYNTSSCNVNGRKQNKLDFSTGVELYFNIDDKGNPIGKWELNLKTSDGTITIIEECYKDTRMVEKYIYSYNPLLKKRILESGAIYYPLKDRIYYVDYNSTDQSVKNIYLEVNNNVYRFYLKNDKKLMIMETIISKNPDFTPFYDTYKNEIRKILELEISD